MKIVIPAAPPRRRGKSRNPEAFERAGFPLLLRLKSMTIVPPSERIAGRLTNEQQSRPVLQAEIADRLRRGKASQQDLLAA